MNSRLLKIFISSALILATGSVGWAALPSDAALGAATIHRYDEPEVRPSHIAITVWAPMPNSKSNETLLNFNSLQMPADLPTRWVIGDGGSTRAFVGVDLSEGSPLSQYISRFLAEARKERSDRGEALLEYLRKTGNDWIKWTPGARNNDGRPELPWDLSISISRPIDRAFSEAAYLPLFHFPVDSGVRFPVVGLERYLARGEGYCLQKALFASLVLSRAGVSHRLVNGAVSLSPGVSVGHTWIQFEDGRILDVAWQKLGASTRGHVNHPDWIRFENNWRFENKNYLVLAL